jgi:YesN/AraC family two-component response regulator
VKPKREYIDPRKGEQALVAYDFEVPFFKFLWHYHPEYELTLITKGTGKRLVGDHQETFHSGDLVLLGPNVPHTWSSEPKKREKVSAVVIQFTEELVSYLFRYHEFRHIEKLLQQSYQGLSFSNRRSKDLHEKIKMLTHAHGVQRFIKLLEVLELLSKSPSSTLISSFFRHDKVEKYEKRLNKVLGYIHQHSAESITLSQAASTIGLSASAFSKFIKRSLNTTFSDYLNEIRIAQACQWLSSSDKTIKEIAYHTGFSSLTYFNRVFKKKKGMSPKMFRHSYQ